MEQHTQHCSALSLNQTLDGAALYNGHCRDRLSHREYKKGLSLSQTEIG